MGGVKVGLVSIPVDESAQSIRSCAKSSKILVLFAYEGLNLNISIVLFSINEFY